ncbi:histidine phosphotransferase [Sphingorhabdus lutea]|uniref:Histidine phosphotransferase n=1 Tax=Sphingorhabdus lutea TaxID=1913578 RepID=A0A1L3JCB1_9SPHN|nr:histidine phosphotransferase family protein [Sphingorhabdus lutea]APG62787.1 histidine phosphotransferase [Sphingorhabdus lutea]
METKADLASLLCSRLCHDLLSPVGAMNNGLELLADEHDPAMRERCMELLADSARSAATKLKFFRLAFGAAGGFGPKVDPKEAKAVLEELVGMSGKTQLIWEVGDQLYPKAAIKILLNLVFMANEALVRGGQIQVGSELSEESCEIVVAASGTHLAFSADVEKTLLGNLREEELDSRTAAAWMVHKLCEENHGQILLEHPDKNMLVIGSNIKV